MQETNDGLDPATVLARAPVAVREAIVTGDLAALQSALGELPPEEAQQAVAQLRAAGILGVQRDPKMEQLLHEWEPLLQSMAAVARGDERQSAEIDALLPQLESDGWHIATAVRRIWGGERDAATLTKGLDRQDSGLVERLLEILQGENGGETVRLEESAPDEEPAEVAGDFSDSTRIDAEPDPLAVLETMPPAIRRALMEKDMPAFLEALQRLPSAEAAEIVERLERSGVLGVQPPADEQKLLQEFAPFLAGLASVAQGDASSAQRQELEELLGELAGRGWQIKGPVEHIWAGERDAPALTSGLDAQDGFLVRKLLQILAE